MLVVLVIFVSQQVS